MWPIWRVSGKTETLSQEHESYVTQGRKLKYWPPQEHTQGNSSIYFILHLFASKYVSLCVFTHECMCLWKPHWILWNPSEEQPVLLTTGPFSRSYIHLKFSLYQTFSSTPLFACLWPLLQSVTHFLSTVFTNALNSVPQLKGATLPSLIPLKTIIPSDGNSYRTKDVRQVQTKPWSLCKVGSFLCKKERKGKMAAQAQVHFRTLILKVRERLLS